MGLVRRGRKRAQGPAARPETEIEYSRAQRLQDKHSGRRDGRRTGLRSGHSTAIALGLLAGGALGSALLLVAEFTPLLHVHSSASRGVIGSLSTGSEDSYALVPVAVLAAALTYAVWRTDSRLALLATGLLGLLALLIALLGDLPDAQATGLTGSAATGFATAKATPSTGLYLETLGAIVLLITGGAGLLLLEPPGRGRSVGPSASASSTRSTPAP